MTRDDIIRMAREAGFRAGHIELYNSDPMPFVAPCSATDCMPELERFAALVAAAERDALRAALQHEADCVEAAKAKIADLRAEIEELHVLIAAVKKQANAEFCLRVKKEEEYARLRAKIEKMERQEPVGVLHVGSCYGEELEDWEFEADQRVCDRLNERHVTNPTSLKLYALPGAKGE